MIESTERIPSPMQQEMNLESVDDCTESKTKVGDDDENDENVGEEENEESEESDESDESEEEDDESHNQGEEEVVEQVREPERLEEHHKTSISVEDEQDKDEDQISWQTVIAKNPCCQYVEKHLKKQYKQAGGIQGYTGEGSMDGTGTSLSTHKLLQLLSDLSILGSGTTVLDLGSGSGLFATHLSLFDDIKCIGIEIVKKRLEYSILGLGHLNENFEKTKVFFCEGNILKLNDIFVDVVYAFNKEFPTQVSKHIVTLLTKAHCPVKYAIFYDGVDLELESVNAKTKWNAIRVNDSDSGARISHSMHLMIAPHTFSCNIYKRVTPLIEGVEPTIDPLLRRAWNLVNDPSARLGAYKEVSNRYLNSSHHDSDEPQPTLITCENCDFEWIGNVGDHPLCHECENDGGSSQSQCSQSQSSQSQSSQSLRLQSQSSKSQCSQSQSSQSQSSQSVRFQPQNLQSQVTRLQASKATTGPDEITQFFVADKYYAVNDSHSHDVDRDHLGQAVGRAGHALFLDKRSRLVNSSKRLSMIAIIEHTVKFNGTFINGIIVDGVQLLAPMSISRKPEVTLGFDNFKSIKAKYFDLSGSAWIAGFRVNTDKSVHPLMLVFNQLGHVISIEAMVSTASEFVKNLKLGEYQHLLIKQQVPEEVLFLMYTTLTSDLNVAIKGLRGPAQLMNERIVKLESKVDALGSNHVEKMVPAFESKLKAIEDTVKTFQSKISTELKAKSTASTASVTATSAAIAAAAASAATAAAAASTATTASQAATAAIDELRGID